LRAPQMRGGNRQRCLHDLPRSPICIAVSGCRAVRVSHSQMIVSSDSENVAGQDLDSQGRAMHRHRLSRRIFGNASRSRNIRAFAVSSPTGCNAGAAVAIRDRRCGGLRIPRLSRSDAATAMLASGAIIAEVIGVFADCPGAHLGRNRSLAPLDSARGGTPEGQNRPGRVPTQRSAHQMELIENSLIHQWLAMKARSRLRVICATPFQKRPVWHRSERFLCCVCRSVR
jgi:hypothetical protein